MSKFINPRLF